MRIKGIIEEDFINYKKPSMVILMPYCDWKCGNDYCHNSDMALAPMIKIEPEVLAERFCSNPITEAIVFSGLEPMLSFQYVVEAIQALRACTAADIIIYTGYNKEEIEKEIAILQERFTNIIIKFGRYLPGQMSYVDEILGIELVSPNQYAEKIC